MVEVTDEMVEAGARTLNSNYDAFPDGDPNRGKELLRAKARKVLEAALAACPAPATEGDREVARRIALDWYGEECKAATLLADAICSALANARNEGIEAAAKRFDDKAAKHAIGAKWMGPERQYYEGPRIPGVEMSPMNGPAMAHDAALANAAAIRALRRPE